MTSINTFATAFDSTINKLSNLVLGENGSLQHSTLVTSDVDLDGILCELFLLVRGENSESIIDKLNKFVSAIDKVSDDVKKDYQVKLFKLILFIRQPRKGKGEKDIFYSIIEHLFSLDYYKGFAKNIIKLVGDFGYYKDLNHIYEKTSHTELKSFTVDLYVEQLKVDLSENDLTKLSLAAKWAPREGSVYHEMAQKIASKLVANKSMRKYRQQLSELNKKLNTVQTFMCHKHWADIDFKNVPSVSMTNLTKAFQDEKVSPKPKSDRVKVISRRSRRTKRTKSIQVSDDNRRHHEGDKDYEDRQKCRENLFNHIKTGGKVNAQVTDLSTIIQSYLRSSVEDIVWEAQWTKRVEEIQKMVNGETNTVNGETNTVNETNKKAKIFPMVDLSSSMSGSPMIYAITFGLFTSQIMDNPTEQDEFGFANRFMSFATEPQLVRLPRNGSLKEKVDVMKEWTGYGKWGGTTNIHKAIKLLLNIATTNNLPQEEMPEILAVFSDMQFDQGDNTWTNTSYENISEQFVKAGYKVPHVLFWDLRANTLGYQVMASTPNSSMLSGYSTRMLDLFLCGKLSKLQEEFQDKQNVEDTNNTNKEINNVTTLTLLNKALNHDMFKDYDFNDLF